MNIDYFPGNAYLKPLSGGLFVFVHDFCTTFDDILTIVCKCYCSEVGLSTGANAGKPGDPKNWNPAYRPDSSVSQERQES